MKGRKWAGGGVGVGQIQNEEENMAEAGCTWKRSAGLRPSDS